MKRLVLTFAILIGLAAPAWAGFAEGVAAYKRGDYATALRELRPLANQGVAEAQCNLGVMYSKGQGVPQDDDEAVKWYRKAAEQGHAEAQFQLGAIFAATKLTPTVTKKKPDLARVQHNVGKMIDGDATEKEIREYLALEGVTERQLVQFGRKKLLEPARKKAVKWFRKATEQGHAEAQYNLGLMYSKGDGVQQDYAEAEIGRASCRERV